MATVERERSEKLAFLGAPGILDGHVECIETHMSWVFLTADHAFKLKKPVRLPYLDHRTLDGRRRSCEQELRLGRRLAASVYQGLVPLVRSPAGLALGGQDEDGPRGEIVDWVVQMRRLPAELMLPAMLARGAATLDHADAVGELLARFYGEAPRASWGAAEYQRRLHRAIAEMAHELVVRGTSRARVERIATRLADALDANTMELVARVAAGRVVEAHGDLRPEHVCLERPPVIIDPLEFDADLRTLDALSELTFFALECERLDASWFGDRVLTCYGERTGDPLPHALVEVYRGYHAITRALLALRHLDDRPDADERRWRERADGYLRRVADA